MTAAGGSGGGRAVPPRPTAAATAAVALGAAVGSLLRWFSGLLTESVGVADLPWDTLAVNTIGAGLMGLLLGRWALLEVVPSRAAPLLTTGFLGGLTTFSAFANETVLLAESGRVGIALAYIAATLVLGLAAYHYAARFVPRGRD